MHTKFDEVRPCGSWDIRQEPDRERQRDTERQTDRQRDRHVATESGGDLADFLVEQEQLEALFEPDASLEPEFFEVTSPVLQQFEQVLDAVAGGCGRVPVLHVGVDAHLSDSLEQQLAFL